MKFGFAMVALLALATSALAQAPAPASEPIGEVFSTDASVKGSVLLAAGGTSLLPGSSVDAGQSVALVKLRRGGTLRVCKKSSVDLNLAPAVRSAAESFGQQQPGLMLSMGSGALEVEYPLGAQADTVITPDFRLLLAGPAAFHVAISVDGRGNTCVRSLVGNSGAVLVSELLGGAVYQVKPTEAVLFANGAIQDAKPAPDSCGCPEEAPARAIEVAQVQNATSTAARSTALDMLASRQVDEPAQPAPAAAGEPQVEVDAPFVFQAVSSGPAYPAVASLRTSNVPAFVEPVVVPPVVPSVSPKPARAPELTAERKPQPRRGFFSKIGGFFASLFGHKSKPAQT
jgi:hypothetical protein